ISVTIFLFQSESSGNHVLLSCTQSVPSKYPIYISRQLSYPYAMYGVLSLSILSDICDRLVSLCHQKFGNHTCSRMPLLSFMTDAHKLSLSLYPIYPTPLLSNTIAFHS